MDRKQFYFTIDSDDHARLRIKLKYESMSQAMFFNYLVKGYLEEDPLIIEYMQKVSLHNKGKASFKKRLKDKVESENTVKEYCLDKNEIENIFDILEKEQGDL